MRKPLLYIAAQGVVLALLALPAPMAYSAVRIKDLARFDGVREQPIIGYGIVVGLSGTGDSQRSVATLQSVSNMLREFGLAVPPYAISSRNVAAVIVTADLPGAVRAGDRFDVNVAALGDARSLAGGTLLMTPLMSNNRVSYAMAQGPLAVGGYKFEQRGTSAQKNFPTAGTIPAGAIAQRSLEPDLVNAGTLELLLDEPDYTTATRVAAAINHVTPGAASAVDSGRVRVAMTGTDKVAAVSMMARIESITIDPDVAARVVVNERTGTVVSGGDVYLSAVTVSHGDLRVSIVERFAFSQPEDVATFGRSSGIRSFAVPEAEVHVSEDEATAVSLPTGATIAELVNALRAIKVSSRDVIAILQGIKRAGALHAELVVQ